MTGITAAVLPIAEESNCCGNVAKLLEFVRCCRLDLPTFSGHNITGRTDT